MGWWGKVFGGAFGFMLGGPLGALLGAALGHNFDKGLSSVTMNPGDVERIQSAFFTATFSIMGHVAKSDGRVTEEEIEMARQVMQQMQLPQEQQKIAMRLFNEGKEPGFRIDAVLDQFRQECHRRRNLLQMFMEIQIATTMADGKVQKAEREILIYIGDRLGFSLHQIDQLLRMVQAQQHYYDQSHQTGGRPPPKATLSDAYAVLGIKKSATDADVKKAYRRLMNQHHPDKLVAKGLPEEMMKIATEKTQEIKMAYEQIKNSRGMR